MRAVAALAILFTLFLRVQQGSPRARMREISRASLELWVLFFCAMSGDRTGPGRAFVSKTGSPRPGSDADKV
jgi:hypothetical protein